MVRSRSGFVLSVLVAVAVAATTPAGADTRQYQENYRLGLASGVMAAGCPGPSASPIRCPVGGVVVCSGFGLGGNCLPTRVGFGEQVSVTVTDDLLGPAVSFGVCVDGDGNMLCRPETSIQGDPHCQPGLIGEGCPQDSLVFNGCNTVAGVIDFGHTNTVSFTHLGGRGDLILFMMQEVSILGVCLAVAGTIDVTIVGDAPECSNGLDDDGDGTIDDPTSNPLTPDPDCTGPQDGSERPPPPGAGH